MAMLAHASDVLFGRTVLLATFDSIPSDTSLDDSVLANACERLCSLTENKRAYQDGDKHPDHSLPRSLTPHILPHRGKLL